MESRMCCNERHSIYKILNTVKKQLRNIDTDASVDRETLDMSKRYIQFCVVDGYFERIQNNIPYLDRTVSGVLVDKMIRMQGLSKVYFDYFAHYWEYYYKGNDAVKDEVVNYGESCILAIGEVLKLEERLFNLTTKNCIVK